MNRHKFKPISVSVLFDKNMQFCNKCKSRMFCENPYRINLGYGNVNSNTIVIFDTFVNEKNYNFNKLLRAFEDKYKEILNRNALEDLYITKLVKCNNITSYDFYNPSIVYCKNYLLFLELNKYNFKNIVFVGETFNDLFDKLSEKNSKILLSKYNIRCIPPFTYITTSKKSFNDRFDEDFKTVFLNIDNRCFNP